MDKLIHAGAIVVTGALLGVGFWAAKKLTQKIDDKLAESDSRIIKKIRDQYFGDPMKMEGSAS